MNKAAIFDFNGTLFNDSLIHHHIWEMLYTKLFPTSNNFKEVFAQVFGANNLEIIKHFYKVNHLSIGPKEATELSKEKERLYREYCIENDLCHLTKGAEALFKELIKQDYHLNIATASIKENVDFFFNNFPLRSYFKRELVTYDNGNYQNKVEMYKDALINVDGDIENALVFEDSRYGVRCAKEAGYKKIYVISPDLSYFDEDKDIKIIRDFSEFAF